MCVFMIYSEYTSSIYGYFYRRNVLAKLEVVKGWLGVIESTLATPKRRTCVHLHLTLCYFT